MATDKGYFSFLAGGAPVLDLDASVLDKLGHYMSRELPRGNSVTSAIYVYFGQFMAHDMTHLARSDQMPAAHTIKPEDLVQKRSSCLDLDSVYGSGFEDPNIRVSANSGRMVLGETAVEDCHGATLNDLPRVERHPDLKPHIPDERNDENLLTAQMHVLFLKLHNRFVQIGQQQGVKQAKELFRFARRETINVYHQIILEDFLRRMLHPNIYEQVIEARNYSLFPENSPQLMPIEFSAAAFRFGHSTIRTDYKINDKHRDVPIQRLFKLTGRGHFDDSNARGLPQEFVVDWSQFLSPSKANLMSRIDPKVTRFDLPGSDIPLRLAQRNLRRGTEMGLPSAQNYYEALVAQFPWVRAALRIELLSDAELESSDWLKQQDPKVFELIKCNTPLWYYLLAEAKVKGDGDCLGPLGSLIVGSTILGLLLANHSVVAQASDHWPSPYLKPANRSYITMADVIRETQN